MPWTDSSGVSLYYCASGHGECLVLLHELGGSVNSWNDVRANLPASLRVLCYDQRGAGLSEKVRLPFALEDQVRDLEAVLDAEGVGELFWIVAVAAASQIALQFAERYPHRVAGLILCSPAVGVDEKRRTYLLRRSAIAAKHGMRAILDLTLERSFPEDQAPDHDTYLRYRGEFLGNDPVTYGLANHALADAGASSLGRAVTSPCLILGGDLDLLRPPDSVRAVAERIPGAQLEILRAGHFMHVERGADIAARILSFMNTVASIPPSDTFVEARGLRFRCRVEGKADAPWIVFGNSLATNLDVWQSTAAALANRYRILRYDQRGHGLTGVPADPCTFDVLADDAIALMDHFGIAAAVFIGVSMGAVTALRATERFPHRIRACVACDGQPSSPATNAGVWHLRMKEARTQGMESLVEPTVARWFPPSFDDQPTLGKIREMIRTTPVEGYVISAQALLDYDLRAGFATIRVPVLLLAGAADGILPAAMRAMHGTIANSRYREIDGAGHLPNVQTPQAVLQEIELFLATLPAEEGGAT
jgi:3-oxoadipate enol-lactonase